MKKFLISILIIILILIAGIYTILFTPPGNNLVKGIIENKLNEKIPVKVKVENFKLTMSHFLIKIFVKNKSSIFIEGDYSLFSKKFNGDYSINLIDLAKFEKIINYRLNGNLYSKGKFSGDIDNINIEGFARFAGSKIDYSVNIMDKIVKDLSLNSKKIIIANLLKFLNLPVYADGYLDINGKISNLTSGKITTKIYKTKLFAKVLNREFNLKLKKNVFLKGLIDTKLTKNSVILNSKITTNLANIDIPEISINLKTNTISDNYILIIPDLRKLYNLTQTKLRGKVTLKGKLFKSNENLKITGASNIFNGKLNFILNNDNFKLNLDKINTSKIFYMLIYPAMFNSVGGGNFNYLISKQSGSFDFKFTDGRLIKKNLTFIPRTIVSLVNAFTGVDLTRELFKVINLNGNILKNIVNANLYLKSKLAEISTTNAIIDINRETIKSLLKLKIGSMKFSILIAGKWEKPSIKLNPGRAILQRPEIKKIIKNRKIKKIKKRFKNFKKIFN